MNLAPRFRLPSKQDRAATPSPDSDAGKHPRPALPRNPNPFAGEDPAAPREISERDFVLFQTLIYRESGIWLSPAKTALLTGRLSKRLRHHRLKSFKDYYKLVLRSAEERVHMLDAISTNETHFFREPSHFELLRSAIIPSWVEEAAVGRRASRIRVLSAGCSTGQEPYSLAMLLLELLPVRLGWEIEIVATDLSSRALDIAERGIWPLDRATEIPRNYLKSYMLRGIGEQRGKIKAGPRLRSIVRFVRCNLHTPPYPFSGEFELVFCRNVLIYFDSQSRYRVLSRLLELLAPNGYLFVGHAESLHGISNHLRSIAPTVYKHSVTERTEDHDKC
jgi:chemotaxis protein methyltransferase CheR